MPMIRKIKKFEIKSLIKQAIEEDLEGYGDITSRFLVPFKSESSAYIICKEKEGAVLSGIDIMCYVFEEISPEIILDKLKEDGVYLSKGDIVCRLKGPSIYLLAAERTALNFLQHLSGIATYTSKFVSIAEKYNARIADTRKTTPCLRKLEKYAVTCGGGFNHRFGLFDGVLIKDNHIIAAGSITKAIKEARNKIPHQLKIEVEVKNFTELEEAIENNADIIMLDNMDFSEMKDAVRIIRERLNDKCVIEASGGVNLDNVEAICRTGVDIISTGCITHSAPAVDFSLEFE